ncbi:hypothetical protein [Rhizobium sp. LC145]|uniref:hypothetical protein n=1 Tax=Rhizobium sp. LC145 TaxID=1120688 RepID=UPI00062A033B|nr:hypothetical protein [Rhizobium sp. LC145]KKX33639.1 hypothetical protein YH62_00075 [Rhizobium sp. LC145]TKT55400.1 hypothetical protein FDR95_18760 [Rhizobiaceae bacterium LC148]
MTKTIRAGMAAMVSIFLATGPAIADSGRLIWQPAKSSDTSYSVKMGMRLPTRLEPEAGINMGMSASKGGALVETPVNVWGRVKTQAIQRPAYESNRDIDLSFDALHGSGAITMNYYDKRVATPTIDVERRSSYAMRYDGVAQEWCGLETSQSLRIARPGTVGTAFVVKGKAANNFETLGADLGLEQKFGKNMTLSGSLGRTTTSTDTAVNVNARYSFTW